MESYDVYLGADNVYTDSVGIKQLLAFYEDCKQYNNVNIQIKLDNLLWLDGNLCAFLGALVYRLKQENNLVFSIDAADVNKKCKVLFYNEFLPIDQNVKLYKGTCIPFKGFLPKQKDEFISYLENELLAHKAMPTFSNEIKEKLIDDLIEIYGNIDKHAETEQPFFVCGQFYPKQELIKFSLCDLGVGFYKKIKERKPETTHDTGDAILWAIAGNSTKTDASGGMGLKNLHQYFNETNGGIQIYTGDTNWCSKTMAQHIVIRPKGITVLDKIFKGSLISLEFNKKSLLS